MNLTLRYLESEKIYCEISVVWDELGFEISRVDYFQGDCGPPFAPNKKSFDDFSIKKVKLKVPQGKWVLEAHHILGIAYERCIPLLTMTVLAIFLNVLFRAVFEYLYFLNLLLPRKPQEFAENLCFFVCLLPLCWNSDSKNSFATWP